MVWGLIRVAIFTVAFLGGLMFGGSSSGTTSAFSNLSEGMSLVVACDEGRVIVTPLKGTAQRVIQLNCAGGNLLVVRNAPDNMEIIPNNSPIH